MTNPITTSALALALLVAAAAATAAPARIDHRVVIHLTSGAEVSGTIPEGGFDEAKGITLLRDDNGGRLDLRWEQIRTEDHAIVKRLYGFEGDEPPALTLQAVKLKLRGGDEVIGLDGGEQGDKFLLVRRGIVTPVPKSSIMGRSTVVVDALEVENPPEAFQRVRREQTPKSAVEWYNLGLAAEGLTLYEQAKECFEHALAADAKFSKRDVIEQRTKILDAKLKEVDAAEALRRIRTLRVHREYGKAIELALQFVQERPSSLLLPEILKEQRLLEGLHRKQLLAEVRGEFFSILSKLVDRKVLEADLKLPAAMNWAQDKLFDEAMAMLADQKRLDPKAAMGLWNDRGKLGSATAASYAGGTFILGPEEARKDLYKRDGKGAEGNKSGADEAQKKEQTLEEKIQAKLKEKEEKAKQRDKKRNAGTGQPELADVKPTPEEWWAQASFSERAGWVTAFFAERCGKVFVEQRTTRDCSQCGGRGYHEFLVGSLEKGGIHREPCARCKGLTFDRIIHFK